MALTKAINQNFNIALGDGGKYLTGTIIIAPDGKVNKKIVTSSQPLPLEFFEDVVKLVRVITDLEIKYDGIKTIEFKEIV